MTTTIGVMGLWHLGCVLTASWYKLGFQVTGFDYNKSRVANLNNAIPPLFEPDLSETFQDAIEKQRITFSSDIDALSECEFIFLSYDTPVNEDDSSDLQLLNKCIVDIRTVMKDDSILIVSSQSPVGLCSLLRNELRNQNPSLELAYSPENLRLGEAINCYLRPERIVLGSVNVDTENRCKKLFSKIDAQIYSMSLESAEMVKHGINSFLANSIVFANHLADLCEEGGADIVDVVAGMKSDRRIGKRAYLAPGIGFSGGTLGRDLRVLEELNSSHSGNAGLFKEIYDFNKRRKLDIVKKITKLLDEKISGRKIAVLGLTYKPGTSTLRRSLPLEIVVELQEREAKISVFDPKADFSKLDKNIELNICDSIESAIEGVQLILILTEWRNFQEFAWKRAVDANENRIIFDAKNCLSDLDLNALGFRYHCIGRGTR